MSGVPIWGRTPRWILWLEILVLLAVLGGLGIWRFSRITPAERLEIQLEAELLQLHELEADHLARHGVFFDPAAPAWRPYLPWLSRHPFEARAEGGEAWSVVVRADLDGDGEAGAWRVDHTAPAVTRVVED